MRIEQRYNELLKLRIEINEKLKILNFEKIKELILELKKSVVFQKLKKEDNQLSMLDCFFDIWIEEKKELESVGIHEDIFWGIHSLEEVEQRYLAIKFCILRIENKVPLQLCEESVKELVGYRVSGIAIGKILIIESCKRAENAVVLAHLLKMRGEMIRAIYLLQKVNKEYPNNTDILTSLAECWIEGQQWRQAYECLKQIEKPDEGIRGLIQELEKVMLNEAAE
ncbi:MAG: tetratricopeptide repeat protein [Lachnospiraceae bacterium]|nr:tetratricopeptide repeat protein [Lachnospiraceae bacterium]